MNGSILTINIILLSCPLGLELDKSLVVGVCSDFINGVKTQCIIYLMLYAIKQSGNKCFDNLLLIVGKIVSFVWQLNNVVALLSTLIFMAYSKLLFTIKNALMLSRP